MKRFAFTMLELVIVIVVIGILAVVTLPKLNNNPLRDAAEQVAEHIRYTQHLAMVDDKYDSNDGLWFRENWQIQFTSATNVYYEIYSDVDHNGNSDNNESALDPQSHLPLDANTDITDLKKKYGITSVSFSPSCSGNGSGGNPTGGTGKELSFDTLGRPYFYITSANPPASNMYKYLLKSNCNITIYKGTTNATVQVAPETGFVSVIY